MAATDDFMVSRIGSNAPSLMLVDHFESIRDINTSTKVATGIVTIEVNHISELRRFSESPHVKSANSPFKETLIKILNKTLRKI